MASEPNTPAKKRGLFSWFRRDKEEAAVPAPVPEPVIEQIVESPVEPITAPATALVVEPGAVPVVARPEPIAAQPTPPQEHALSAALAAPDLVVDRAPAVIAAEPAREALLDDASVHPVVAEASPALAAPEKAEGSELADHAPLQPETRDKPGLFARLRAGLSRTRANLAEGLASIVLGKKAIDEELLDELETQLLTADVGVEATNAIIGDLTKRVARKELADADALMAQLKADMRAMLAAVTAPLNIEANTGPYVILVVGVNGVGKTTTIGKLASRLKSEGKSVMLAAGDTFRAAAVEQLQVWGQRNDIGVIAQHTGADSASVIFDAVQAAKARGVDVLIADTAGRLHTKDNLMEELRKVVRVMKKLDDSAPHEVLLVLDAGTGQNALNQASQFNAAVPLTGLALTKLDGTAKGGVIFALAKKLPVPIRFIGVGEGIADLRPFDGPEFVDALFSKD